jgi:putative ubiquitin-RnfH superfamily antitoxin RatB of RatAB toxin-antitoxin module
MARLSIEVVFALRDRQEIVKVELEEGATALDALNASGLGICPPGIESQAPPMGIFGRRVLPTALLKDGDRLEIYRPLRLDPKEARRSRASANRGRRR